MNIGVAFAPLVGTEILWTVIAAACLFALLLFVSRSRGAQRVGAWLQPRRHQHARRRHEAAVGLGRQAVDV